MVEQKTIEALKVLKAYTAGRFDIWALAGSSRASCRAHVMSVLVGQRMPQSKSGVNAIREAFDKALAIEGGCIAEREDNFIERATQLTN